MSEGSGREGEPAHIEIVLSIEKNELGFIIGDVVEACEKQDGSKVIATVTDFRYELKDDEATTAVTEIKVRWMSDTESWLPVNQVFSMGRKRERKQKIHLEEEDDALRSVIGIRARSSRSSIDKSLYVTDDFEMTFHKAPKDVKVKTKREEKFGALLDEIAVQERLCDQTLLPYLPHLSLFLTEKVKNRLRNVSTSTTTETLPEAPSPFPVNYSTLSSTTSSSSSSLTTSCSSSSSSSMESPFMETLSNIEEVSVETFKNIEVTVDSQDIAQHDSVNLLTPSDSITATLRDYQIKGFSWLVDRYDKGLNCILADEMGLGKTLQTITFISYLKEVRGLSGPHLVVVPLSVLFNWMSECKKFCRALRLLRLHSNSTKECNQMKEKLSRIGDFDICITTYEMIKSDRMQVCLQRTPWRTVVLDEGHRVKNMDTDTSKSCCLLKARFKLILTGTPVQNNLHETFCLLHYLNPSVFESSEAFDHCFQFKGGQIVIDRGVLDKAHYMLRPFVLRRVKLEVEQKIPPKLETLIKCPLSDMQRFWIRRLLLKDSSLLDKLDPRSTSSTSDEEKTASDGDAWKKLQSLLAQLRKAANHPYLFPGAEDISDGNLAPTEEIVSASGKMVILDRLLPKLLSAGHRVVLFSQYTRTLDIITDYLEMREYEYYRLDGQTHRVMREVLINQFNKYTGPEHPSVFCLSTRAGGEGVNLFTADTVILFDSDWNPQVDIQAMARVHRIGQTKVVHVYRLVTTGTVEERIVQRAQKKLFLDCMVSRGSSARAHALDAQMVEQTKSGSDDFEDDDLDQSTMLSALKFGWNACFGAGDIPEQSLSDADLEAIIDRSRGVVVDPVTSNITLSTSPSAVVISSSSSSSQSSSFKVEESSSNHRNGANGVVGILEHTETSVAEFEESAPLVNIRLFEGEELKKAKSARLSDISQDWALEHKRQKNSRLVQERVVGVGMVSVLKINQYSLDDGEPSVYEREAASSRANIVKPKKIPGQRAYENSELCQKCWDGGDLLLCDLCPASYHKKCLDKSCHPVGNRSWKCPHHLGCITCGEVRAFAFRCEACPNSYCEDCLPADYTFLLKSYRWAKTGYKQPGNSCMIFCSADCCEYSTWRKEAAEAAEAEAAAKRSSRKKRGSLSGSYPTGLSSSSSSKRSKI